MKTAIQRKSFHGRKLPLAAQCQLIAHTQAMPGGGPHPEEQVPLLYANIEDLLFGNFALQDLSGPATLLGLGEEGGKVLALSFGDHCGDDILAEGFRMAYSRPSRAALLWRGYRPAFV